MAAGGAEAPSGAQAGRAAHVAPARVGVDGAARVGVHARQRDREALAEVLGQAQLPVGIGTVVDVAHDLAADVGVDGQAPDAGVDVARQVEVLAVLAVGEAEQVGQGDGVLEHHGAVADAGIQLGGIGAGVAGRVVAGVPA
ncbi:hypothetical protein G6F59_015926 [Rhizopus arrhizus]|nr:hypothetical protein G6F59_015926 [Rhizopus arrhizus]